MLLKSLRTLAVALMAGFAATASAQNYPSKPIRVIVPFAVGSGTDIVTRMVTEDMGKTLGVNFVVENKPGASGQIAAEALVAADPDG